MSFRNHHGQFLCLAVFFFVIFYNNEVPAVTLVAGQTDYTTTSDITTSGVGISSSLSGTSSSYNKITNNFTITTGNSGATSSAYGIKSTGSYNQIINSLGAAIVTTASSGRGISIASNSIVSNAGSIVTQGSTSYGIYAGSSNNNITNSGSILTSNSTSYGIYLAGDNNILNNSGLVNTRVYGIYSDANSNRITNSGTIVTTVGSSAHGIFVSAGSSSTATALSHGVVGNYGVINANAHGIYNKDNYSEITNSGVITSGVGASNYGIRNEGDYVTISNSGNISATNYAIYNSGVGAIINNSGAINGGIMIGAGTLNISGGTISGDVDGSENNGSVTIASAVNFNQNANFSALNSLTISDGATLNSSATIDANTIFLGHNAVLSLGEGSSLSGVIEALGPSQGSLNIYSTSLKLSDQVGSATNPLSNISIASDSVVSAAANIYADQILLAGTLNFDTTNNLTLSGELVGSGSGTFNLGSNNQQIDGDLILLSGDTLQISTDDNGAGKLVVTGSVSIASGVKIAINNTQNQNYTADNTSYQILTSNAASSLPTEISSADILLNGTNSNISGLLEYNVSTSANDIVLNVNHLSATQVTKNTNAQNIYQSLVNIGAESNGKLRQFQQYLDQQTPNSSQVTRLINELAPQSSKAALATTANVVSNSIAISQRRLHQSRQDSLHEGSWGQIFGSAIAQDQVASDDGYKANSAGIAFGIDREISPQSMVGAAFAISKSAIKMTDSTKQNLVDTYQINLYGSKNFGKYFIDGIVAAALNRFDSNRAINTLNSNAVARYFGQTYVAKFKTGFEQKLKNGFSISPELDLNLFHQEIAGYSEKGAEELNLTVSKVAANFVEMRSGINLGFSDKIQELPEFRKIAILTRISYGRALINDSPTTTAGFQGQSQSFDSKITHRDNDSVKLGFELAAFHKDDVKFSFDYELERKRTYGSHFAVFKVRQEF